MVTGFDNDFISNYVSPALTTVEIQKEEVAKSAMEALLSLIRHDGVDKKISFTARLVIRDVNPFFNDFMQISKLSPWSRWIAIGTLTLFAHHLHTSTNQSSPEYAPVAT